MARELRKGAHSNRYDLHRGEHEERQRGGGLPGLPRLEERLSQFDAKGTERPLLDVVRVVEEHGQSNAAVPELREVRRGAIAGIQV